MKYCIWILCSIILAGCSNDNKILYDKNEKRVIIAYLAGDNDLSGVARAKIEAMKEGWNSSIDGRLLIYYDANDEPPTLIEISSNNQGETSKNVLKYYSESNSADPSVMVSVINEIKRDYPADSYGLIIFSHASGWLPQGSLNKPRSIVIDQDDEMELIDFAKALSINAFDFIIFESCLMAGIEVLYELKDKTPYILASSAEILDPGFKEIYSKYLSLLYESTPNLTEFTKRSFEYFNNLSGAYKSATFTLFKTSGVNALADFIKNNAKYNTDINLNDLQSFTRNSRNLFIDFEDYFSQLMPTQENVVTLNKLIDNCIVYKIATESFMIGYSGFQIKNHSGLTTYVLQEQYPYLNGEYKNLNWYKDVMKYVIE